MWAITNNKNWQYLEETFAWVADMQGVKQDARHHAEGNVAIHTQMVLQALEEQQQYQQLDAQQQAILWAAALLHDVEKRSTTVVEPDGSITANGHARKGAITARQILYKDLPAPFAVREAIAGLVRYHGLPIWALEKPNPRKQLVMAAMEVNTQWLALLARADVLGRICADQQNMLYRIDLFEEFCRENNCWGQARPFASNNARMHYIQHEDSYIDYIPFDEPQMEVVMLCGLPGAGKDSYIQRNYKQTPVVSLDDLRVSMKIAPNDKEGNGQVVQAAKEQARVMLRAKKSFVWNATNTTRQMRTQLVELFTSYKALVKMVYVEAPYKLLHKQNHNREAIVPTTVIEKLIRKLEVPAPWEAHEVVYQVQQ